MKKTLTINLGGIVFHIDEDAYISLNQYLDTLNRHFGKQEGFQDILNDIESRIAEILADKRPETQQVIALERPACDTLYLGMIAGDSVFSISQVTIARGRSRLESRQHLAGIRFQSAALGSSLNIGPYARLPKGQCWRGQTVSLVIHVPKGKFVRFDQRFHDLKPDWYYMMNSTEGSIFQMTENGMEVSPL